MRILLANEARSGAGGVETYLSSLVPLLEARGHDVALLHDNTSAQTGPTSIAAREHWSAADEGIDGALARAAAWHPDVGFSHNMRRLEIDERLAGAMPLVKMMHGYFGTCVSGQKAFAASMTPCARTCGPACLVQYVPRRCGQLRPAAIVRQYRWAGRQRRLFDRYAGIVVASEHMRAEYMRHGVPPRKVSTVPLFAQAPLQADAAPGTPIDVLFLGRMTPLKGGDALLRAAAVAARSLGRPLSVAMAGEGPARPSLEALAVRLGIDVRFHGWVDACRRTDLLRRSRIVALPSLWPEPFGLIGLEAAALGVPAVAFDVGGIRQWLEHDVNGLFVPAVDGVDGFARALSLVLSVPERHRRLSAGAAAQARRMSADAHASALERILAEAR